MPGGERGLWFMLGACLLALPGCGGPEEAPRVELPVFADGSGVTAVTTDLGFRVELSEARMRMDNLVFTWAGELHAARTWERLADFVVPTAQAHPGHHQAGDITGTLPGQHVVQWLPAHPDTLGVATLLAGDYESANFRFARVDTDAGVASDDPLHGHTAILRGVARKDEQRRRFTLLIDSPQGRELVGAPFEASLGAGARGRLGLRLVAEDPIEGDTLFDGVDFAALAADEDGIVRIAAASPDEANVAAYHRLRRTFQTHDHFEVSVSLDE